MENPTWLENVISEYNNIGTHAPENIVNKTVDDLNDLFKRASPELVESLLVSICEKRKEKYKQHFTEDGLKKFISEKMRKETDDIILTSSDRLFLSDIIDPYKSRKTGPKDKDLMPIIEYWIFKWRDKLSSGYKPGRHLDGVVDEEVAAMVDWTPDAARIGQQIGLKRVKTARRKYKALIEKLKSSPQDPI